MYADFLDISQEVQQALREGKPVVALESVMVACGLPHPTNLEAGRKCEQILRDAGVVPGHHSHAGRTHQGRPERRGAGIYWSAWQEDFQKQPARSSGACRAQGGRGDDRLRHDVRGRICGHPHYDGWRPWRRPSRRGKDDGYFRGSGRVANTPVMVVCAARRRSSILA